MSSMTKIAGWLLVAMLAISYLLTPAFVQASSVTYTSSNLSLDTDATLSGTSNLRKSNNQIYLNFNKPLVDSHHIGYWGLDDGSGTTVTDSSNNANNGSVVVETTSNPKWAPASSYEPYAGEGSLLFGSGDTVNLGSVLDYEKTQPWTVMVAVRVTGKAGLASVIFSNVKDSPYPGYEFWITPAGKLSVRLINDINSSYVGVVGTTDIADSSWHMVAASYDGSATAAGVKIFIDGVEETTSVESDNLTGSIISATHGPFIIGNQNDLESTFNLIGQLDEFSLSNIVRAPSWIAQYSKADALPPTDGNTVLNLHFDEGKDSTASDSSSSSYNGTITGAEWGTKIWLGTSAIVWDGSDDSRVSVPSISAYNLGNQFTLTSWANSVVSPPGAIFQKIVASSPFPGWGWHLGYLGTMQWWDSNAFRDSTLVPNTGWHFYALRFNNGTLDFFIDGLNVKTITGVLAPSASDSVPLSIGAHPGLTSGRWNGWISHTTISDTPRSDAYIADFAKRFASSGVTSLSNISTAVGSGGGNFGSVATITSLLATFTKPTTTALKYRIGTGNSAAAATADKQAQSFSTLNSTNSISKIGQYVDFDIQLTRSTDSLGEDTPILQNVSLVYSFDTTAPTISNVQSSSLTSSGATITWDTNEAASSQVEYGTTTGYGTTTTETDTEGVTIHSVAVSGLANCTTYHYRVISKDLSLNTQTGSDNSFTTTGCSTPTPTPTVTPTPSASATSQSTASSTDSSCHARVPIIPPSILSATAATDSIVIQFNHPSEDYSKFVLRYTTQGVDREVNFSKDLTAYTLYGLSTNSEYTLKLRAYNDCAEGVWSDPVTLSTKPHIATKQLALTTTIENSVPDEEEWADGCKLYTVQKGDTLWKIGQKIASDGNVYTTLRQLNQDQYQSLKKSDSLKVGWKLKTQCLPAPNSDTTKPLLPAAHYSVHVTITNSEKQPVSGAHVTLHSNVQEAVTDSNGVATFTNVEPGQHKVLIAYQGYKGEESISVQGDTPEIKLHITIEPQAIILSPWIISLCVLCSALAITLFVLIFRQQKLPAMTTKSGSKKPYKK